MIYFVNGKARLAFSNDSMHNNAIQAAEDMICKEYGKKTAA